jgi:DNA-binding response OmpR family regulator
VGRLARHARRLGAALEVDSVRVLIVEDDDPLRTLLRRGLSEDGYVVDALADGRDCREFLAGASYDAMVLDLNLPGEDGLSILRRVRADGHQLPVLILTARDSPSDVVAGLDAGADDYLRKPFAFDELEARLRSLARRPPTRVENLLRAGDVVFNCETRQAKRGTRDLHLTVKEALFLEALMRNAGRTVTRRLLEDRLWDRENERVSNVLDVYARRLRAKLSQNGEPQLLHTIRGLGYRLQISEPV